MLGTTTGDYKASHGNPELMIPTPLRRQLDEDSECTLSAGRSRVLRRDQEMCSRVVNRHDDG